MTTQTQDVFAQVLGSHRGDGARLDTPLGNELTDIGMSHLHGDVNAGNVITIIESVGARPVLTPEQTQLLALLSHQVNQDIRERALPILRKMLKGCYVNSFHAKTMSKYEADGLVHLHAPAHQKTQDGTRLRRVVPLCTQRFDSLVKGNGFSPGSMEAITIGEWDELPHCPTCEKSAAYFVETLGGEEHMSLPEPWHTLARSNADNITKHLIERFRTEPTITLQPHLEKLPGASCYKSWSHMKRSLALDEANALVKENLYRLWVSEYLEGALLYLRAGQAEMVHECMMHKTDPDRSKHQSLLDMLAPGCELSTILDVNWRLLLSYWFLMQSKAPDILYIHTWSKEYPHLVELAIKVSLNPNDPKLFDYLQRRLNER